MLDIPFATPAQSNTYRPKLQEPMPASPSAGDKLGAITVENPVLTPAEVASLVSLPRSQVRIQGVVTRVFGNPDWKMVYGEVAYGDGSINFALPAEQLPAQDTPIVIEGTLGMRYNKNFSDYKFQLQITGRIVGTYEPSIQGLDVVLKRVAPRVRFSDHFKVRQDGRRPRMLILGSETAKLDIGKALDGLPAPQDPKLVQMVFNNIVFHPASACVKNITERIAEHNPDIVVIARGGGASQELAVSANSPLVVKALLDARVPFYSAVGHEHDLTLLDKYSDESFHTPTAVGQAICQAEFTEWSTVKREKEAAQNLQTLADGAKAALDQLDLAKQRKKLYAWILGASVLINVAGAVALFISS